MKSLLFFIVLFQSALTAAGQGAVKTAPAPAPPAASPAPTSVPAATPEPTPIPMAEVVGQAELVETTLQEMEAAPGTFETVPGRDLAEVNREISARLAETSQLLQRGVLLETLRDLDLRWERLGTQLSAWSNDLASRAELMEKELALLPRLQATWAKTLEQARAEGAPPEIQARIEKVQAEIAGAATALTGERSALLTEQSRVAAQAERAQTALGSVRAAQSAAVGELFERDSPPIWNAAFREETRRDLAGRTRDSFIAQAVQLRAFAEREWPTFITLALIFGALALSLFWVKRQAAKWTDDDPALRRANRVLQLPLAMAAVLSLLACQALFVEPPRLFWVILSLLALFPVVVILRRLIARHLFPILNALIIFYLVGQGRKLVASLPGLSRLILLLEMIGGALFLLWYIRSTRRTAEAGTTARKATRAGARLGLFLFAAVFISNLLGYFRLSNYLAGGALAAAYLAIFLYAAAGVLSGLVFFALQVRPFAAFGVVRKHRPLLQRRLARFILFVAVILWGVLTLDAFALRGPLFHQFHALVTAEVSFRSLHLSLGAILAFVLTIWLAFQVSRFLRFLLEEDVYSHFNVNTGSSYAVSTLLHYGVLLVGFLLAIAAMGLDMTKFTVLAGALGVGIGFGLQNIVNNFVSGLILLFEQPVKVGDVVKVDAFVGVIRRIGIRASVIRLFDSSELIVPNGQLISEKVTNWTLSNRQRRIEIPVGVAYGTEPRRVIELLTRVAGSHPLAAQQPAPQTIMSGFGADALEFEVRLWTDDYDQGLQIKSDVAVAITEALAEADIAIPFPQRDLHLQSIDPAVADSLRGNKADRPTGPPRP